MVEIRTLDCGVRVVMEQVPHVQSAAVGIWVKAGSVDEEKQTAGISHLIEHMLFKGTENRTAKQIAEDVDRIGGQINAFTGREATCYYIKTLSSNLEKAGEILLDMFLNSKFDRQELAKEKNVISEEIKMIEDSPEDDVHEMISEMVFKGNPLAQSIIGTPSTLKGISPAKIKAYMDKEYTRDNIVVSVSGNFNADSICGLFEGRLCTLQAKKPKKTYVEVPFEPAYRVKVKDIEQTHICLGTRGICLDDQRYYAFALLNNIMGGSMSSRLFQNIREEKGLAYSVYSMSNSYSDMGYYNIYAGVSHDKVKDALLGIKEELEILQRDGVTADELATAKEQLKGGYIFSMENVNGRMFAIGKNTILLGKVYTTEEVIEGIDKVTLEDIAELSKLISDIGAYSCAVITNKKVNLKKILQP